MSDLPENEWHIYDLIETAQSQIYADQSALFQVLGEADRLVQLYPALPEAHFLRGWALNYLWGYHSGDPREAAEEFYRVLQLDPFHQWALWYTVVLSALFGDHTAVLDVFARLDRKFFADDGKDWRYLKAWEYALCSHLILGHVDAFKVGVKGLVQEFVKVADDPDEWPEWPAQLMGAYRQLRTGSGTLGARSDRRVLGELLKDQLMLLVSAGWIEAEDLTDVAAD